MKQKLITRILHSNRLDKIEHGSLHKPIHSSVAFNYEKVEDLINVFQNKTKGYSYGRQSNPTITALEKKINQMEDGVGSVCFSTGMASIATTCLALLKKGDHLISSQFLFGNTNSLFRTLERIGIGVSFVDATQVENIEKKIYSKTKIIFVETIANPKTQIADLLKIGELCKKKNLVYIIDNTITTSYLFSPKAAGASFSLISLTKYIAGHGNTLGGCITDLGNYNWENFDNILDIYKSQDKKSWALLQIKKKGLRDFGSTLSPLESHLISIGMETLFLRMEKQCQNTKKLCDFLEQHSKIDQVFYPGSKQHPQHKRAKKLLHHFGAIFSFTLKKESDCLKMINRLKVAIVSSNLGDVRTLVIPVAKTIFYEIGPERRKKMGINESMIRVSVGIEAIEDLIEDFKQAL